MEVIAILWTLATPYTAADNETLLRGCVKLEILDPREVRYTLNGQNDAADMGMLRARFRDLWDAPRLCEVGRLPPLDTCRDALSFNRALYFQAGGRVFWDDSTGETTYRDTCKECDWLYRWWDAARDAQCEYFYVAPRRLALERCRDTMPLHWAAGIAPPCYPFWRY